MAARDLGPEARPAGDVAGDVAPPEPTFPLKVGVRHCSLEHAPYRLVVGHFQGLPLSGAESRLNERSDGRLERLLLLGLYPQLVGESAVFDPVDEAPPNGMVVIGLGPSGELTAVQLRAAVTRALLRVALNELDRRVATIGGTGGSEPWRPLGISSVLIGTSAGGGLPVDASVRALIDAIATANSRLARLLVVDRVTRATDIVRFDLLEFTERYEDRVDLIVSALAQMEGNDRASTGRSNHPVTYLLTPARGEGASSANPPIDTADEVWRRVDIRAEAPAGAPIVQLEFTSIGRLARAERMLERVERELVDRLLREAINDHADASISGTLYELLIPHELKGELGSSEHLHLLVDEHTADLPWELLRPRRDEDDGELPLALRVGVLRQFREHERLRFDVRRASGNNALVIGNPPVDGAPSLPGAASEAVRSAELLAAGGWNVQSCIWDVSGRPIAGASKGTRPAEPIDAFHLLLNGDWRVVHIAAHGHFTADPTTTGVLLGNLRLTANTFSRMSVVPDLVVLNACHLGQVEGDHSLAGANHTAASVGRALLQLGVRAAVVAGWAVDDGAARAFADRLVRNLLSGQDFGPAVTAGRRAAWEQAPTSLTWGAYQCYGDPGFCLAPKKVSAGSAGVHTVGELRRRARRLASAASDQGRAASSDAAATTAEIRRELEALEASAETLHAASAYADLADVWADLLDFDAAIRLYEVALADGGSTVPVRAVEQLGNLLTRRARQAACGPGDEAQSRQDLRDAHAWLQRALDLGTSGERLALLGGFHKRAAALSATDDERAEHLREAIRRYGEAHRVRPTDYDGLNWLQLVQLARLNGIAIDDEVQVDGAVVRRAGVLTLASPAPTVPAAASDAIAAVDFWQRAAAGDRLLTAILLDVQPSTLASDVTALVDAYEAAFRLRSSARERASVIEHLRDLTDLAPSGSELATALDQARIRLEHWRLSTEPITDG